LSGKDLQARLRWQYLTKLVGYILDYFTQALDNGAIPRSFLDFCFSTAVSVLSILQSLLRLPLCD